MLTAGRPGPSGRVPTLVVFSHLRWGPLYQRPQHLLSRLAGRWRVVFIEEPVQAMGPPRMLRRPQGPDLEVWVPHTPVAATGFDDRQLPWVGPLVRSAIAEDEAEAEAETGTRVDAVLLYTPMAEPLLDSVNPDAMVVYDCMDDLSAFRDAPEQLHGREAALLQRASIILTGGPSLYESMRRRHACVHCLPNAVDRRHFEPRQLHADSAEAQAVAPLLRGPPGPRLGYFGLVDERLDTVLVDTLAQRHPDWQIIMAGPVIGIDAGRLPRRANLHWIGLQPHGRLPYLLAGWDLALLPLALNLSGRCGSPGQTLEYLAGDKPVVSTALYDVISLYGHVVEIAHDTEAFVAACERLLAENGAARCRRSLQMMATVSMVSWDRTAQYVDALLHSALHERADRLTA